MRHKRLYKQVRELGHTNNCAIVAAIILTGRSPECVIAAAEKAGKLKNRGMNQNQQVHMYAILDHSMKIIYHSGKTAKTVKPQYNNCTVHVKNHVGAWKNGQLDDWMKDGRRRIKYCTHIVPNFQSARKFFAEKQEETKC